MCRMVLRQLQDRQQRQARASREDHVKVRRVATSISRMVKEFWNNIQKVVWVGGFGGLGCWMGGWIGESGWVRGGNKLFLKILFFFFSKIIIFSNIKNYFRKL